MSEAYQSAGAHAATAPLPVAPERRRWFLRPLALIPLTLLLAGGVIAGILYLRLAATLSTVQQVSTPAPVVSAERLGGDGALQIDTGPAQVQIAQEESGPAVDTEPVAEVPAVQPGAVQPDAGPPPPPGEVAAADQVVAVPTTASVGAEEADAEGLTVLLMGVDARAGEAVDVGVRPDALAVLQLDADSGACRLLAIPRDTRVNLPGYGLSKVNHALAVGGIPYQEIVVEELLGITIDRYGLIDFSGVIELVEAVGGITVTPETPFTFEGVTFGPGPQRLDGETALLYARYRGGADGDFGRIVRQQEIIRAILREISGRDVVPLVTTLFPTLENHLRTDLNPAELIRLANQFRTTCTEEALQTEVLEGTTGTFFDPLVQAELSYVLIDDAEIRRQVAWLINGD